jgi:dephospho-CoA kinase
MLRVGLTGGIGCGKTTVAAMLRERGCHLIKADEIAHRLIEPGQPAYDEILQEFGEEILTADRSIDRKALGAIVFANPDRLAQLNAIIHPRVLSQEDRLFAEIERADPKAVAFVEAALLIESGFYRRLDRLVVVWCRSEQQIARLTEPSFGRGMTSEDAQHRIAAQLDIDEKRRLADDVIDSSGSLEETRKQVAALVERLKAMAAAKAAD